MNGVTASIYICFSLFLYFLLILLKPIELITPYIHFSVPYPLWVFPLIPLLIGLYYLRTK